MAGHYNAGDLQVLEGLDAVRMRPGMYIGSTGTRGSASHACGKSSITPIDEAGKRLCRQCQDVTINKDGCAPR